MNYNHNMPTVSYKPNKTDKNNGCSSLKMSVDTFPERSQGIEIPSNHQDILGVTEGRRNTSHRSKRKRTTMICENCNCKYEQKCYCLYKLCECGNLSVLPKCQVCLLDEEPRGETYLSKRITLDRCYLKRNQRHLVNISLNRNTELKLGKRNATDRLHKKAVNLYGEGNYYFTYGGKPIEDIRGYEHLEHSIIIIPRIRGGSGKEDKDEKVKSLNDGKPKSKGTYDNSKSKNNRDYDNKKRKQNKKTLEPSNRTNSRINEIIKSLRDNPFPTYQNQQPTVIMDTTETQNPRYYASTPIFVQDPCWLEIKDSTEFGDILAKSRFMMCKSSKVKSWFYEDDYIPSAQDNFVNICCYPVHNTQMLFPRYEYETKDGSYAVIVTDEMVVLVYKTTSSHLITIDITDFELERIEKGKKMWAFDEFIFTRGQDENWDHMKDERLGEHDYHPFMVNKAKQMILSKPLNTFNASSFVKEYTTWMNKSVFSEFYSVDYEIVINLGIQLIKSHQISLNTHVTKNKGVLSEQKDTVDMLQNPASKDPEKGLIFSLLRAVAPEFVYNYIRDKYIQYTQRNLWDSVKHWFLTFIERFSVPVSMKAFPQISDNYSILLEELIKTIPFGDFAITLIELRDDFLNMKFDYKKMITRFVFHCCWSLLPGGILTKLITLPLRLAAHYAWNKLAKYLKTKNETNNISKTVETLDERMNRDKLEDNTTEINTDPKMPRFQSAVETEHRVDLGEDFRNALEFATTWPTDTSAWYIGNSHIAGSFPAKTTVNFHRAVQERCYQEQPKKALSEMYKKKLTRAYGAFGMKMNYKEVKFEEWAKGKDKEKLYKATHERLQKEKTELIYSWNLMLKTNELIFKEKARVIHAMDDTVTVTLGPMMESIAQALKNPDDGLMNGETNLQHLFGLDRPLYALYASVHSHKIEEFCTRSLTDSDSYYLAIVGDDSVLLFRGRVLSMDMSRFDSTQNPLYAFLFKEFILPHKLYEKESKVYNTQQDAPTYYEFPENKGNRRPTKITIPRVHGLRTGCPETSISNSIVMLIVIVLAVQMWEDYVKGDDFETDGMFKYIETSLRDDAGFLPKAKIESLKEGFEFLKKGWIIHNDKIRMVPLLSNFAKIGKSEIDPRLIVPGGKFKTYEQASFDFDYGVINSMFAHGADAITTELLTFYLKNDIEVDQNWKYKDPDHAYKLVATKNIEDEMVDRHTLDTFYYNRYRLQPIEIDKLIADLKCKKELRPRKFKNPALDKAIDVDYGRD